MKRLVSAFLAGAMALSLAACGGAASTSTAASASASASGSAAASQAAGSDLDYIKGKGKLVIGYTVYEPMNYTDAEGNAYSHLEHNDFTALIEGYRAFQYNNLFGGENRLNSLYDPEPAAEGAA